MAANKFLVYEHRKEINKGKISLYMTWFRKKKEAVKYLIDKGYVEDVEYAKNKYKDEDWNLAEIESVNSNFWFCRWHRHDETMYRGEV